MAGGLVVLGRLRRPGAGLGTMAPVWGFTGGSAARGGVFGAVASDAISAAPAPSPTPGGGPISKVDIFEIRCCTVLLLENESESDNRIPFVVSFRSFGSLSVPTILKSTNEAWSKQCRRSFSNPSASSLLNLG